jgi:hypothetical protein
VEGEVLGLPKECDRLAPERAPPRRRDVLFRDREHGPRQPCQRAARERVEELPVRAPSPPAHQHRRMTRIIVGNIVGVFAIIVGPFRQHRRPFAASSSASSGPPAP